MPPAKKTKTHIKLIPDRIDYGDGLTNLRTIPLFDIFLEKEKVGHITAGHALIRSNLRGQGHFFFDALPKYERIQKRLFTRGFFEQYKEEIIEAIGLDIKQRAFAQHIRKTTHPTHFQFWRDPKVALKFIQYGSYTMAEPSIKQMEERGLPKNASQKQILDFLRTFKRPPYPSPVLFLLEKKT